MLPDPAIQQYSPGEHFQEFDHLKEELLSAGLRENVWVAEKRN